MNDCDSVNTLHTSADVIFITSATVFVSSVWSFSRCLGNVWLLACITQDSPGHGNLNHHHQPSCAMEKIHFNIGTFKTTYLAITDGCLRFSFPGGGKSCLWRDVIEIKKEVIINWIIQRSSTACWWQILEFYTGWGEANQEIWLLGWNSKFIPINTCWGEERRGEEGMMKSLLLSHSTLRST